MEVIIICEILLWQTIILLFNNNNLKMTSRYVKQCNMSHWVMTSRSQLQVKTMKALMTIIERTPPPMREWIREWQQTINRSNKKNKYKNSWININYCTITFRTEMFWLGNRSMSGRTRTIIVSLKFFKWYYFFLLCRYKSN